MEIGSLTLTDFLYIPCCSAKNRAHKSKNMPNDEFVSIYPRHVFDDNWVSKVWAANVYIYSTYSAQEVIGEDNKWHENTANTLTCIEKLSKYLI